MPQFTLRKLTLFGFLLVSFFSITSISRAHTLDSQKNPPLISSSSFLKFWVEPFEFSPSIGNWNYKISWERKAGLQGSIYINNDLFQAEAVGNNHNFTGFNLKPDQTYVISFYSGANKSGKLLVKKTIKTEHIPQIKGAQLSGISWTNTNNVLISDNNITSKSPCACGIFDSGATSTQQITASGGYIEFTIPQNKNSVAVGLNSANNAANLSSTLTNGLEFYNNYTEVRENG